MSNALTVTAPEGLPYIDFEREFDAPVARVFAAHRDPALVAQWSGPDGYVADMKEWDFRSGGTWHYVHRDPEGNEYGFRGTFHTVRENEYAVQTFEFLGFPDVVSIESLTFEDLGDGRTRLRGHAVYPTLQARDGMVASGMETGMSEGYDRLEAIVTA
ncbi:SRPBCC family protein [Protaetiibacter sp. SSC-01]|uniref:SRPBCC family protein n=1 Tax=Protaetiibacter sp. SSC-01 TaxID=2759943 RepID=UPI00165761D3|nr:SRPBCC family protein [Protaetiibacter sp. SSC-01]QNO37569.1 SRPBCC family protein [Protaetiibacter sp. SSC-01]